MKLSDWSPCYIQLYLYLEITNFFQHALLQFSSSSIIILLLLFIQFFLDYSPDNSMSLITAASIKRYRRCHNIMTGIITYALHWICVGLSVYSQWEIFRILLIIHNSFLDHSLYDQGSSHTDLQGFCSHTSQ